MFRVIREPSSFWNTHMSLQWEDLLDMTGKGANKSRWFFPAFFGDVISGIFITNPWDVLKHTSANREISFIFLSYLATGGIAEMPQIMLLSFWGWIKVKDCAIQLEMLHRKTRKADQGRYSELYLTWWWGNFLQAFILTTYGSEILHRVVGNLFTLTGFSHKSQVVMGLGFWSINSGGSWLTDRKNGSSI